MLLANLILGMFVGACLGSFISASAWRIKTGISLKGNSRCDQCGKAIPPWRNVPVLTWVIQRGKGACCGASIPASVLWVETGGAVAGGLIGGLLGVIGLVGVTLLSLILVGLWSVAAKSRETSQPETGEEIDEA